ncbi:hypothetical protein AAY473_005009 [Plecturocebus cupreus]
MTQLLTEQELPAFTGQAGFFLGAPAQGSRVPGFRVPRALKGSLVEIPARGSHPPAQSRPCQSLLGRLLGILPGRCVQV